MYPLRSGFRDFRAKVLVKSGSENRKPIRDGYNYMLGYIGFI